MTKHRFLQTAYTMFLVGFCHFVIAADNKDLSRIRVSTDEQLPHIKQAVIIDGVMDETVWDKALKIALDIETSPADNQAPPVKTTAYLFEDGENLYVGFKAEDPEPEKIRAYYRARDNNWSDDNVTIIIDPSNLRNLGYEFIVNALGSQMDGTEDDLNKRETMSWDGIWESAGQINEHGFIVEMAIPFRLFRIPEGNKKQTWGFELLRFYPRNFVHRISNNPRRRNLRCHLCQMSTLNGFEKITHRSKIQLVPSLVLKQGKERDLSVASPIWDQQTSYDPGLDIRWGINPEITFSGTINPDFSQVEADAAQLSINTQNALFFPEKRSFFQEGADIFTSQSRLVHTRLIGDPDWGIKLTGENANTNWALFSVDDAETTILLPGNQGSSLATIAEKSVNTSARLNHSFGNGLNLGALVTNRESDNYSNTVASVDGRWNVSDTQQLSAQFMNSNSRYPDAFVLEQGLNKTDFNDNAVQISYNYSGEEWFGDASYFDFGKDFRADLGFVRKVDYDKKRLKFGHKWFGDDENFWSEMNLSGSWEESYSNDGELLERENRGEFNLSGPWSSRFHLSRLSTTILFNGVYFEGESTNLTFEATPKAGFKIRLKTRFGNQIDFDNTRLAEELFISPQLSWNLSQQWLIKLDHVYQSLDVNNNELFNVTLDDLRITWQKNNQTSIRLTTQYQNINRDLSLYLNPAGFEKDQESISFELLYSYKLNPQSLVFVGINTGSATLPNSQQLKVQSNLLFVKFSYSWLG